MSTIEAGIDTDRVWTFFDPKSGRTYLVYYTIGELLEWLGGDEGELRRLRPSHFRYPSKPERLYRIKRRVFANTAATFPTVQFGEAGKTSHHHSLLIRANAAFRLAGIVDDAKRLGIKIPADMLAFAVQVRIAKDVDAVVNVASDEAMEQIQRRLAILPKPPKPATVPRCDIPTTTKLARRLIRKWDGTLLPFDVAACCEGRVDRTGGELLRGDFIPFRSGPYRQYIKPSDLDDWRQSLPARTEIAFRDKRWVGRTPLVLLLARIHDDSKSGLVGGFDDDDGSLQLTAGRISRDVFGTYAFDYPTLATTRHGVTRLAPRQRQDEVGDFANYNTDPRRDSECSIITVRTPRTLQRCQCTECDWRSTNNMRDGQNLAPMPIQAFKYPAYYFVRPPVSASVTKQVDFSCIECRASVLYEGARQLERRKYLPAEKGDDDWQRINPKATPKGYCPTCHQEHRKCVFPGTSRAGGINQTEVKRLRELVGMSIEEAAIKANLSPSLWSQIESDLGIEVKKETREVIAVALGVKPKVIADKSGYGKRRCNAKARHIIYYHPSQWAGYCPFCAGLGFANGRIPQVGYWPACREDCRPEKTVKPDRLFKMADGSFVAKGARCEECGTWFSSMRGILKRGAATDRYAQSAKGERRTITSFYDRANGNKSRAKVEYGDDDDHKGTKGQHNPSFTRGSNDESNPSGTVRNPGPSELAHAEKGRFAVYRKHEIVGTSGLPGDSDEIMAAEAMMFEERMRLGGRAEAVGDWISKNPQRVRQYAITHKDRIAKWLRDHQRNKG